METDFLKIMLEQMNDGVVIFNESGIILKWNKALEELTGIKRSKAIGENITEFSDILLKEGFKPGEDKWVPKSGLIYCYEIHHPSGKVYSVENKLSKIESQEKIYYLSIIRDITKERNELSKVMQQKNHVIDAASLAGIGIWEWDFETDQTIWSNKMFEIYGIKKEEFTGKADDYLMYTHPEDQIHQHELLQKYFELAETLTIEEKLNLHINPSATKYRIIRKDGEIRHIEGDAIPIFDNLGNMTGLVGMTRDLKDSKE